MVNIQMGGFQIKSIIEPPKGVQDDYRKLMYAVKSAVPSSLEQSIFDRMFFCQCNLEWYIVHRMTREFLRSGRYTRTHFYLSGAASRRSSLVFAQRRPFPHRSTVKLTVFYTSFLLLMILFRDKLFALFSHMTLSAFTKERQTTKIKKNGS